jgi:hypothetical protein
VGFRRFDMKTEKIVEKWDLIGFIKGLDEPTKTNCALSFEMISNYMLGLTTNKTEMNPYLIPSPKLTKTKWVQYVIFPILCRIIRTFDEPLTKEKISKINAKVFSMLSKEAKNMLKQIKENDNPKIDIEAELVVEFSDRFISEELKNI